MKKNQQKGKKSFFTSFLFDLRKKRIIEILAAFIGGGWLILEFVHWILIDHYHFPEESLDITFITLTGALLSTLIWRIFAGVEKKPRKIQMELILIPLIIVVTLFFDVYLGLHSGNHKQTCRFKRTWSHLTH